MIRDDVVTLLVGRLGQRTDLTSSIVAEALLVQANVLEEHEWLPWFLDKQDTMATAASTEAVAKPADFLMEAEDEYGGIYIYNTESQEYQRLDKRDLNELQVEFNDEPGVPEAYAEVGENFRFKPVPLDVYTLRHTYSARDATLSTNIENKWLKYAADLVIAELGAVMAEKYIQDQNLANTFRADAQIAWRRLYKKHIAMREAARVRNMGDD